METDAAEGIVLAGRYRVDNRLGQGGMAEVFAGWDLRLQRPVAVKLLRAGLSADAGLRARFEREARAAARLSHPNVVAVFDAGEDGGQAYIIMEKLGGESLADGIARGPLDLGWLRRMGADVLAALGAAHNAGIVHRDIKPANILIGPDGQAKVADFGIASVIEAQTAGQMDGGLTATGMLIGTPAYLAPERVFGQPATPQSDLYSVGVVLYEALTGRKPFDGTTPVAIAAAAGQAAAVDPVVLRPDADPGLVQVIARAITVDPALRYPSAVAMAAALQLPVPTATEVFPVAATEPPGAAPDAVATVAFQPGEGRLAARDGVGPQWAATQVPPVGQAGAGSTVVGRPRAGPSRRRRLLVAAAGSVAVVALVAALLASHGSGGAVGATTTTRPPSPTSTTAGGPAQALLSAASRLTGADGAAAPQLAAALQRLAAMPPAAQPAAASALLAGAASWQQQGQLTGSAYNLLVPLLTGVGGTVSAPAPTAATQPAARRRGSKAKGGGGGD